jgi:orotate phosphoribosyltransferase
MLYSHPDARNVVVDALVARVKSMHIQPDCIAGTATAAIGWAALVADRLDIPFVYVRSKAKEHGAKKRVEGDIKPGMDIVVIEDLISTGGSSISTVDALREESDANVADVIAIFTYEMHAAREKSQESGVKFHPLCSFGTLLEVAVEQGRIDTTELSRISEFAANPKDWGK